MKEVFVAPEVEVINFPEMDILTASVQGPQLGPNDEIILPDDEF